MVTWGEEVKKVNSSTGNPGNAFSGGIFWKNEVSQLNKLGGEEWVKERRKQEEEKRKPFDEWARRYNAVIDGFKKYENQRNGGYTKDASGGYGAEIDALIGEFDGIRNSARIYGDGDARQYLYTLQDIKKYIGETDSMMAQFRDEDAFNRYVKEQTAAGRQEIYQENADRMAELDRQIEDARKRAEGKEGIEQAAAEFAEASRYGYVDPLGWTSSAQIELKELQAQKEQLEAQQLAYERTQKAADESAEMQDKARGVDKSYSGDMSDRLGTWANADGNDRQMALEYVMAGADRETAGMDIYSSRVAEQTGEQMRRSQIIAAGDEAGWEHLTEDEWNTYYYLRQHSGQAAADRWLDGMTTILQRRGLDKLEKEQEQLTTGQRIVANAATLGLNAVGGIQAFGDDVVRTMRGEDIDPYNSAHFAQNYTGAVRQKTAEAIEKEFEGKNEKLGKYASNTYQAIMSGLDSAIGGTLGMGKGYDVVMGVGAASQRARELYEQGASRGQIALGAAGSGVIEALFEHVSLEVFAQSYLEKPTKGFWDFLGKTLVQAGVEASEEVFTEFGNMAWDAVVRGSNSDNQQAIRAYMADGKSKEEARKLAAKDKAEEIYWAGFGGFVSGGAFGGVGGGFNLAVDKAQNRAFYDQRGRNIFQNGTGQTVMEQANETGVDLKDKVRQLAAEKAQLSVEDFNQLSRREQNRASRAMGKVYEAVTDKQAERTRTAKLDTMKQQAQTILEAQGVQNAEQAAGVLEKAFYEGKLTRAESRIYDAVNGNEVLSQLANDRTVRQEGQRVQDERLDTLKKTWNQGADEESEHNPTRQRERLQDTAQDFEGREEMIASWQEGQEPEEYARGYEQVYRMGAEGIDPKYVMESLAAQGMTKEQIITAYNEGREVYNNGEDRVRQGQEWNDRSSDGSTAQTVAEGTAGEEGSRPGTEGETGRNVPGRLTSAAELGIPGGSTKQTLRVRSEEQYTEADRKAVAHAKENGLECVLVEGDRIYTFEETEGKKHYTKARAVIAGNKMFVQADSKDYNSYQLARHEAGHRQLDSGKVSRAEVRQQLRKRYTEAQIEDICGLYASAYGDSGMSAEEIFDEIICDALGEMNAFATEGQERNAGEVGLFLRDVARAEENSRTEGRDTETENHHKGAKFSIVVDDQKRVYSLQEVEDNIVTVSNMKPITEISSSAFSMEGKRLVDNVTEFFKSIGGKVESKDIGTVELSKRGIKSDMGHGMGPAKAASFAALPEVIKEGRIVDWQENWKERRYDTAVIAAPFTMDGTEYMMGVVVKQTGNGNKFYVHEVMTIKDGESPFITRVGNNADSPGGDSPSVNSVLQKILDVKRNLKDGNGAQFSREMATMADLKEENKHLKERVEFWKEQAHPSKGARANRQDVQEVSKQLKNAYGSKTSTAQVARQIQDLADYIISNDNGNGVDFAEVKAKAEDAARLILGGCSVNVNEYTADIWHGVKKFLRNRKITVTARMKEDIGDFDDFRRRNRYTMHFRAEGDGGTAMDTLWMELQSEFGTGLFSDDIANPSDQLLELEDLLVRMEPDMQNPYRNKWSLTVQQLQNDIINTVMGEDIRQEGKTRVDKAAEQAYEAGYQAAYEQAETEWMETADMLVTAKTQEILEKAERRVWNRGQRYQAREESLRRELEAKDASREERFQQKEARLEERDERREAWAKKRIQRKEDYVQRRIEHGRIVERDRIERAKQAEGRRKITRLAGQFEKMAGTKPGKGMTQHAPAQMLRDISELCRTFEESQLRGAEGYSEKLRQRLEALDAKRDTMTAEQYAEEVAKIQKQTDRNAQAKARITATMEAYAKMAEQEGTAYNEEVHKQLAQVQGMLSGTSISEMTSGQLEQVYDAMQGLMYTVKHANEAFTMGKQKTYTEMAQKLTGQIKEVNATAHGIRSAAQRFGMWQMNPDTFFNMICGYAKGNEGQVVQKAFANGTQRMLEVQREYAETMRPLMELKSVQQMMGDPMKKTYGFGLLNENGDEIRTSRGMMLQIYMLLSQEDSFRSLVYGGFRVPNQEVYYKGDISGAYGNAEEGTTHAFGLGEDYRQLVEQRKELYQELDRLGDEATEEDKERISKRLGELKEAALPLISGSEMKLREVKDNIFRQLTEEDLRCIKAAREWYKRTGLMMADTYEQMNGFRPKLVEDYVPIHRDPNSLVLDIRTEQDADRAFNLEGSGFTKERVKSTAPILLTDFWQELDGQSARMARYVGFAGVQKDFGKIWKTKVDGRTVNELVVEKYGAGKTTFGVSGEEYIKHYIMSVAGGSGSGGILNTLYGNYARATLMGNARVAVSQLASIPTAASVVGWKNMAVGFARGVGISTSTDKKNQLARDSVWFYQRYRGANGATELSDLKRRNDPIERIANSKWGKYLFNWCQEMDVFATASMWCMAEEQAKAKGIKPESEEFKAAVNEIYTDIIRKSQPNYTPTERADILRDQRDGMKLLTMFKTQSNQNLNLLINANGEYMKYKQDLKNKRNGVTEADVKQKREQLANAYTSVILGGTVGFTLIRMAANFLMGAVNAYRDDETGEVTAAATAKGVAKEIGSSLAGMVALGGQLYEIVWATCSGEDFYGISDSAIGAISDLVKNFVKLINDAKDPDKDLTVKHWRKLVQSSGYPLGTPVGNALKFWDGMEMWYKDITGGTLGQFTTDATSSRQYRERVLKYWQEGNQEKMDRALAALIMNSGESTDWEARKKVSQDIANYLVKDKYLDGELTDTEAEELLRAVGHEDPGGKVRDWDTALIQGAWEDGELTDKEAVRRLKEAGYSETKASEKVAKWNLDRTKKAWESGSIDRAGAVKQLKEQGYDAQKAGKTVMNWALDKTEMEWKNGQLTDSQARKKLMEAGLTAEEARTKLLVWGFAEKYPNMDMSAKAIEVFYRTNGIPVEIVNKAWSQTTKDDTVNYIMSTSLSSAKKRELWKAINTDKGWSDKRTPWE